MQKEDTLFTNYYKELPEGICYYNDEPCKDNLFYYLDLIDNEWYILVRRNTWGDAKSYKANCFKTKEDAQKVINYFKNKGFGRSKTNNEPYRDLYNCISVSNSMAISRCRNVDSSNYCLCSTFIDCSKYIIGSQYIRNSICTIDSAYINASTFVVNSSHIMHSMFIKNCSFVNSALFLCNAINIPEYTIFGKKVTKERFTEVESTVAQLFYKNHGYTIWLPNEQKVKEYFSKDNAYPLDGYNAPIDFNELKVFSWLGVDKRIIKYIKNLPEYDECIFNEVTGHYFES